jgi:hypothetical protein
MAIPSNPLPRPTQPARPGQKRPVPAIPGARPNANVAKSVASAGDWRAENNKLKTKLPGLAATDPQYQRIVNRINFNRKNAGLKERTFGNTVAPTPEAPAPAAPAPSLPAAPGNNPDYMKAMFPDVDPRQYMGDYLNSPDYQWRLGQGQKALDRVMSRDGLTSSGADIQANTDLVSRMSGEQYENALGISQGIVGNKMSQGGQLQRLLQDEATRKDQLGQNQTDNYYKLLALQASQNPMQYVYQGLANGVDLSYLFGKDKGQLDQASIMKQIPSMGGGGGSPIPAFQAPFPSQPNQGASAASGIFSGASSGNDYLGALGNILGGLF